MPPGAAGMLHTILLAVSRPKGKQGPSAEMEDAIGLAILVDREGIGFGPHNFGVPAVGGEMVNVGAVR